MRDDHYDAFIHDCCILNTEKTGGATQNRCGVCKSIYHPIDGHIAGIEGTLLAAWEPSCSLSWIRKCKWRCVGGSMDTDNLRGDLPAARSVAPSLEESGKLEHVGKDTKDFLTLEHGMEVDRNLQDAQHQTDKDQLLKEIHFSYFFQECGGFVELEKLLSLSNHYEALYKEKVSKLSSEQKSSHAIKLFEVVTFLRLRPGFNRIGLEKQAEIVANGTITEVKNIHDNIVSYAAEMASSFVDDLAGLALDDIIQKTASSLDFLHSEGVAMISKMCYSAVSRLLMLGRSVVYNAKKAAGKRVVCASEIDEDIMNIDWPVDCIEKAKIIKIRAKEMNGYLEAVSNSFVIAMSKVAGVCVAAIELAGNSDSGGVLPQESIQEKVHQYSEDLRENKGTAVFEILYGLKLLSHLVNSTSLPID